MLYNYIKEHYKEAEPILLADLLIKNITESELNYKMSRPNVQKILYKNVQLVCLLYVVF